jgi:energy-coupling factor transporter ATP-binding protein EcfA2
MNVQDPPRHMQDDGLKKGEVTCWRCDNISLSFGGVKAIKDISLRHSSKGEIRAIIGPNGAGKTSMLNVINGFYHPQEGVITFRGKARSRMRPYEAAASGHCAHLPERGAVQGHVDARQHHVGAHAEDEEELLLAGAAVWSGERGGDRAPLKGRGDHRFPRDPAHPQDPGGQAALRPAEAGRTRPRAGDGAGAAAARRADGGHEPRGKGGHEPLHPRRERPDGHDHRADRARHGRGHGPLRPGGGARLRRKIGDGPPDEVKNNQDVIDAYLGVSH